MPEYVAGCVVAAHPIITVSKTETRLPLGLASIAPERLAHRPSLHFLGMTWSCETRPRVEAIARDIGAAAKVLPHARFVVMTNTPLESLYFSQAGVENVLANELIFVDERLFTPRRRRENLYDAVYVARLNEAKRHDLAAAVERLLLIYGRPEPREIARVKGLLPRAYFANHELNGGAYKHLSETSVRDQLHRAGVGLCLSPVEGAMRASLEYRFCGLPVVSIHSDGGRDRYLLGPHVRVVDQDPDAVAAAVRELDAQAFDPLAVREYVARLVAFDRRVFLGSVNSISERVFGMRPFRSFAPFIRHPVSWRRLDVILAGLDEAQR